MSKKPVVKPEGNGEVRKETINPERLVSLFASSRDLSLNKNQRAQQPNKRSYAPNLNVARNKNTDKSNGVPKKETKSDRGRGSRGRGGKAPNFNNNKKGNIVQTVGFMSEGIAAAPVSRRGGDHYGGSSRDAIADTLQKPRIVKRDTKPDKMDLDAEQKTLTGLLGEGGDDELDLDDEDSKNSSSDDFLPIKIKDPSKRSIAINSKKLVSEVKIKTEILDDDVVMAISDSPENSIHNGSIKIEPGIDIKSEAFHRMDKLFEASHNEFLMFQLPDALPGRAPDSADIKPSPTAEPDTEKPEATGPNLCSLGDLDEGRIGKLVRYKSGKTKLVLGDIVYDVDLGLTSDFQQHAVTINSNADERSANMYSLGSINAKFNVTPDWIHLFHKMTP